MGTVASPALLGRNRPQFSQLKMMKAVVIVVLLAVSALAQESIISYDAEDHKQNGDAGNAVRGSYSHTDAEGNTYTINYVADENGYRAEGEHLPVAPEVPAVPEVEAPVVEVAAKAVEVPAATYALPYYRSVVPTAYHVPSAFNYGYSLGYPFNAGYAYNYRGYPYVY